MLGKSKLVNKSNRQSIFCNVLKTEIIKTAKTYMQRFFGQQQPNDISQSLEIANNPALVTMTSIQFQMRLIFTLPLVKPPEI
jgi:hypothetical protein